jgi:chromosome partitioning protein
MPRLISILNQKGGVAKTTTAKNLSAALASLGKNVLLIDFDPQSNATSGLFKEVIPLDQTIYNLINPDLKLPEGVTYKDFIKTYNTGMIKFDVLPSGINLSLAELGLTARTGREFYFRNKILSKIEGYDFIIVDCQPSLGTLVVNVLCSSNENELIIPVRPDSDSREAIGFLFESITSLRESLGIMPKSYRILITQILDEQKSDRFNQNELEKEHPENMFKTTVRKDTKLAQARDENLDIFTFAPDSRGAEDYLKIAKEILGG